MSTTGPAPLADVFDVEDVLRRPLTDLVRGLDEHGLRLATALMRAEAPALKACPHSGALVVRYSVAPRSRRAVAM